MVGAGAGAWPSVEIANCRVEIGLEVEVPATGDFVGEKRMVENLTGKREAPADAMAVEKKTIEEAGALC